jgi:hypothetical protein
MSESANCIAIVEPGKTEDSTDVRIKARCRLDRSEVADLIKIISCAQPADVGWCVDYNGQDIKL